MAKMIEINERLCLACKSCELECALAHGEARSLAEAVLAGEPLQSRVHVEAAGQYSVPLQCRHCEDAPCIAVCPTEAIRRPSEHGPVLINAESCIGCKFCLMVCPFGVIDLSRDGKALVKCDLCVARTEAGLAPACVWACPTGALKFEEVDELLRRRRRQAGAQIAAARETAGKKDVT